MKTISILTGKLLEREYTTPFFINILELETVNCGLVSQIILHQIDIMACEGNCSNFKLFLTDAAPYWKKGKILKQAITGRKHVTRIAHALHNLLETKRSFCPLFNNYIALTIGVFGKSKSSRKLFTDSLKIIFFRFRVLTRRELGFLCTSIVF
jgi:hypothetical protein